jgi:hypothetical protein
VADNVTIWYRGARYALGRGRGYYGIWPAAGPEAPPFEWWHETPEGWRGAWSRFAAIEAPGTIVQAGQYPAQAADPGSGAGQVAGPGQVASPGPGTGKGARGLIGAALIAVGVVCGVAGLFPGYLSGTSLTSEAANLVPHLIYLAAWAASGVLILLGGRRLQPGALLGLGTSIVTFGLFFTDLGTAIAGGAHLIGAGLVLGLIGWLACTAGAAVAVQLRAGRLRADRPQAGQLQAARAPGGLRGRVRGSALTLVLATIAALGTAIAFAPSWDSYTLRTAAGATQSVTAGNAFANPAPMIAGEVAVMVALVAVAVVAALWRPVGHGAALLAGAIIPMAAQAISALVLLGQPAAPAQFGISPAQAAQLGLTISSGLTAAFWIYCAFVAALAVIWVRMFLTPRPATLNAAPPRWPQPGPTRASWPAAGESVSVQP